MIDFSSNIASRTKPLVAYLKKQQENRKFIESVELGSTLVLITFFLLFAIRPTALVISSLIGEINSKKVLTAGMKNKINNVILAQDSFSQVQERYLVINSALPRTEKFSYSASQIISAAQVSGINLTNLSFEVKEDDQNISPKNVKTPNKNLKSYAVIATTNSDFGSLLKYIEHIYNNRRHFDISNISISDSKKTGTPVGSQSESDLPLFKLLISSYYWKE